MNLGASALPARGSEILADLLPVQDSAHPSLRAADDSDPLAPKLAWDTELKWTCLVASPWPSLGCCGRLGSGMSQWMELCFSDKQ